MRLLAEFLTRQRLVVSLLLIVLTAVAGYGYFVYEPPADADGRMQRPRLRFETGDFERAATDCIVVVEVDNLFETETIAALRRIAKRLEQVDQVQSLVWLDRVPALNLFGLAEPLLPPAEAEPERLAAAEKKIRAHPLVRGQLVSADQRTVLMLVTLNWLQVESDAACTEQLLRIAREAIADAPGTVRSVELTGRVPLFLAHEEAFERNQWRSQVIAYVAVLVLAVLLFRGVRAVAIVAAAPALGIFWSLGILNLCNELSNPLTGVVLPVLISMVGLTDGVHLMVYLRRERAAGKSPREAARSAIMHVGLACALTSLTTAVGFLSLLLADSPFVQGFGRACAIGVGITFVAVVTFIPLVCSTALGNNIHRGHERDVVGLGLEQAAGSMDWIIRHARLVSIAGILLTLALGGVALTLRPDDRTRDSQPVGSRAYRALEHCDRALGGIELVQVVVHWPAGMTDRSPEILAAVGAAQQVVAAEPLLSNPLSVRDLLAWFPGDGPLAGRMSMLDLLPRGIRMGFYNEQSRQALITVRMQDLGIARYDPVFRRVERQLAGLSEQYPDFDFRLTGNAVHRGRNLYQIAVDLARSLGTASIVILVMMTLVYRSVRIGLITVVPNLFPLVVTASVLVLMGQPLSIASVCSFTVCLGIAVDDTIHFLTRYQEERRAQSNEVVAIRRTFVGVGTALIMTTLVLVAGFGTVLMSDMPGHRNFAAMACSTIAAALVGDLIFLPALLAWWDRPASRNAP